MDIILALLAAFGLGSVVTAFVQSWLAKRFHAEERSYKERQAAYIGLLEAYHRAAVERTDEAAKNFAYWQMRCDLVAPTAVRAAIQAIIDTNDDIVGRDAAHQELQRAIRSDLKITK